MRPYICLTSIIPSSPGKHIEWPWISYESVLRWSTPFKDERTTHTNFMGKTVDHVSCILTYPGQKCGCSLLVTNVGSCGFNRIQSKGPRPRKRVGHMEGLGKDIFANISQNRVKQMPVTASQVSSGAHWANLSKCQTVENALRMPNWRLRRKMWCLSIGIKTIPAKSSQKTLKGSLVFALIWWLMMCYILNNFAIRWESVLSIHENSLCSAI